MNTAWKTYLLFGFIIIFCYSSPSHAHKVRVFAWVQQDLITVESSFSGGRKMIHGKVTVTNEKTDETIITGTTDNNGTFTFIIPKAVISQAPILKILVSGGDGHQAHWIMQPEDYLGTKEATVVTHPHAETSPDPKNNCSCDEEDAALFDQILEAKLAPIRRDLASLSDPTPSFNEILGGIGYLIGLAGIAAWVQSRKKQH